MPTASATNVETRPTSSDTRAPWTMPAMTSRPSASVPSGKPAIVNGGRNGRCTMRQGEVGNSSGPNTATATATTRIDEADQPGGIAQQQSPETHHAATSIRGSTAR